MGCTGPIHGWRSAERGKSGKRAVVFDMSEGHSDLPLSVPCGSCHGCLTSRAREWALRCQHEASLWEHNSFVTLTYETEQLPKRNGIVSLVKEDFQLFMKRLREDRRRENLQLVRAGRDSLGPIRFFMCGEYGEQGRPHHHALLFNCGFPDRRLWSRRATGDLYRSPYLESLWPLGFSSIGEVTFESAAYVARYTMKKLGSEVNQLGQRRKSAYLSMSRRPGVGAGWFRRFKGDVFPSDHLVVEGGAKVKVPRYYEDLMEREQPQLLEEVKRRREEKPYELKLRDTAREVILRKRSSLRRGQIE